MILIHEYLLPFLPRGAKLIACLLCLSGAGLPALQQNAENLAPNLLGDGPQGRINSPPSGRTAVSSWPSFCRPTVFIAAEPSRSTP